MVENPLLVQCVTWYTYFNVIHIFSLKYDIGIWWSNVAFKVDWFQYWCNGIHHIKLADFQRTFEFENICVFNVGIWNINGTIILEIRL